MKLIFENWRKFKLLAEITLDQAVDRMENSKVLRSFIKSRIWDPETKTLTMDPRAIEITADRMATMLLSMVPVDLEDSQRGTSLEWILSRGLKDEQISNFVAGWAMDQHDQHTLEDWLASGPNVEGHLEFFFQWQDFMEKKDIFSITSFAELLKVVKNASPKVKAHQDKKTYLDVGEGTEVLRDDDMWTIYAIHNKGAACHWGKGTPWCTAAPGLEWFKKYYAPDSPLFYFEPKNPDDASWDAEFEGQNFGSFILVDQPFQFSYKESDFADKHNEQVDPQTFNYLHKLLIDTGKVEKYVAVQNYDLLQMILFSTRSIDDVNNPEALEARSLVKSRNIDLDKMLDAVLDQFDNETRDIIKKSLNKREIVSIMEDCNKYWYVQWEKDCSFKEKIVEMMEDAEDAVRRRPALTLWPTMVNSITNFVGSDPNKGSLEWLYDQLTADIVVDEFADEVFPNWKSEKDGFPIAEYSYPNVEKNFSDHLADTRQLVKKRLLSMYQNSLRGTK